MNTLEVSPSIKIPMHELSFSYARSSGPGGQNVNKVNSKAILHWNIADSKAVRQEVRERFLAKFGNRMDSEGHVVLSSDQYRDQQRNVQDCLDKLCEMLRSVAVPPKKRKATKPSRGATERRINVKKQTSERKSMRKKVSRRDF